MCNLLPLDLLAADGLPRSHPRHDVEPSPMFDRSAAGSSGDGFILRVRGHDVFIGLKPSRNGCRAGFRHG
jgi:hypothetical protein